MQRLFQLLSRLCGAARQKADQPEGSLDYLNIPPVLVPDSSQQRTPEDATSDRAAEPDEHLPGECDLTDLNSKVAVAWNPATGELQMACRQCHRGDVYDLAQGCKCTRHPHLEMVETQWDEQRLVLHHECLLCNPRLFIECPCCGVRTLTARNMWEICPVCNWEDDPFVEPGSDDDVVEYSHARREVGYDIDPTDHAAGAGLVTLAAARRNFHQFGAASLSARSCTVTVDQFQKSVETGLYGERDWKHIARNKWPDERQVKHAAPAVDDQPAGEAVDEDGWPVGDGWDD